MEGGVGEEERPAVVAPESFQARQGFVPRRTPELSGPFEPALRLATSCFPRATADRLARPPPRPLGHPLLMLLQVGDFFGHKLSARPGTHSAEGRVQLRNHFDGEFVFQLAH